MAETIRVAELANLITSDIAEFLKWKIHPQNDLNHECLMPEAHFKDADSDDSKTHPTDVVIYYIDPFENKTIYLNTDLKSYAKKSINYSNTKDWLISITNGTTCGNVNSEWKKTYDVTGNYEIRGLLFVYNHDGNFDKPFYDFIHDYPFHTPHTTKRAPSRFHLKDLKVPQHITLHIIEPQLIDNILSIKFDLDSLRNKHKVPGSKNSVPINFYYPNRQMSKNLLKPEECPATIELINGPFFIMNFEKFSYFEENPDNPEGQPLRITKNGGNIIYYREEGSTVEEFIFLIETLMTLELIGEKTNTYIRHCSRNINRTAKSNFDAAIKQYCQMWDYSDSMKEIFQKQVEYEKVTIVQKVFCTQEIDRTAKE